MSNSSSSFFGNLMSTMAGVAIGGFAVVLSSLMFFAVLALVVAPTPPEEGLKDGESFKTLHGEEKSKNMIVQMEVSGAIFGRKDLADSPFSGLDNRTYGYSISKKLETYAKNENIKAIFMVFKTPGGTIFGSRAIYDAIMGYKEKTGNPVYVFVEGISASGGVMAMVAADKIFADYGSILGSIGVIGGQFLYLDGLREISGGLFGQGFSTSNGIKAYTVTAGRSKDLGNPFREPTERELAELKKSIDEEYDNFVSLVSSARNISREVLVEETGAMIMGNTRATEIGLIDGTMNYTGALETLAKDAELGEDWKLVSESKPKNPLSKLFEAFYEAPAPGVDCRMTLSMPLAYHGNIVEMCR